MNSTKKPQIRTLSNLAFVVATTIYFNGCEKAPNFSPATYSRENLEAAFCYQDSSMSTWLEAADRVLTEIAVYELNTNDILTTDKLGGCENDLVNRLIDHELRNNYLLYSYLMTGTERGAAYAKLLEAKKKQLSEFALAR